MNTPMKYLTAITAAIGFMLIAFFYPAETFIVFTVGWLFFIPAGFVVYMTWSYLTYQREEKNKIIISLKPTEAMKSLARREAQLHKEVSLLVREQGVIRR